MSQRNVCYIVFSSRHRAQIDCRTKVPCVSYSGDNFASMFSVFNMWLFSEVPNFRSFDEFSERLQTVLFTLRNLVLNAVYNATADV